MTPNEFRTINASDAGGDMTAAYGMWLKRGIDIFGASVCFLLSFPVFAMTVFCILLIDGRPLFFGHRRIGRYGRPFKCWKFRTMVVDAERQLDAYLQTHPNAQEEWTRTRKLRADPRITRSGYFLRRTHLDELPQLWNVLVGEMSLVGPRPVTEYEIVEHYRSFADQVTSVRPGVTGSWQITPRRNDIDYDLRVALDVEYIASQTVLRDVLILIKTIPILLKRSEGR